MHSCPALSACICLYSLLGLAAARVSHQQSPVELQQGVLDLLLALLINILLVEGNDGLGDGLADGCKSETHTSSVLNTMHVVQGTARPNSMCTSFSFAQFFAMQSYVLKS